MSQWISDQNPPSDGEYLVFLPPNTWGSQIIVSEWKWERWPDLEVLRLSPTHWMPLPAPPEGYA